MSSGPGRSPGARSPCVAAPPRSAAVVTTLTQFRPDFHPRIGAGARRAPRRRRRSDVVPHLRPRPAERPHRLDPRGGSGRRARRPLARRLPRLAEVRALRRRAAAAHGAGRGRRPGDGDADRASSTCSRGSSRSRYPILGAFAFETSGYSKLSDWPGGGVVGVHGTNTPWLIGPGRLARLRAPSQQRRPRAAQARPRRARRSRSSRPSGVYAARAASKAYASIGIGRERPLAAGAGRSCRTT